MTTSGTIRRRCCPNRALTLADDRERGIDPGDDLVVVDRANHGDHHVRPPVPAVVERPNLRSVDRLHGLGRAEHFPTERMTREQALGEDAVDDIVGRIGAPGELFENHLTFGVEFGLGEPRIDENVEQGVQAEVEFPGRNSSVKAVYSLT